jgi:predicted dehydrogenase
VTRAERLGVGVIGVGLMGSRHAENVARHVPEARLVALHDADNARCRRVAEDLGAVACATVEDLLAREDVRAVVVTSPSVFHEEHAVAAARAGRDVLLEKPIALTLAGADRVIAAVRENGVRLQVGFQRRYDPAYGEAHRLVRSGTMGEPFFYRGTNRDREAPIGAPGTLAREHVLVESAIHDLDAAPWLVGDEVRAVRATLGTLSEPSTAPCPDLSLVTLLFARGAVADIETLRGARYAYDIRAELVCTEGSLLIGGHPNGRLTVLRPARGPEAVATGWLDRFADAYLRELQDFVGGAIQRRPPAVGGEDGRRALAIALAALEAANGGGSVAPILAA